MTINNEHAYPYVHNPNYYVTKSGAIYSIYVKSGHGKTDINHPHAVAYSVDRYGYYRVVLCFNGAKKYIHVHTIIVEQFIGPIPAGMTVNHKNGKKTDNNLSNLEIMTNGDNTRHAHATGLTSTEKPVNIIFNNQQFHFDSMTACTRHFPDISRTYLQQIQKGIISFAAVEFKKQYPDKRITPILAFFNGKLYKIFETMQDADIYFKKKRGTVSSAFVHNVYRHKVNQYQITFPNLSTIESYKSIRTVKHSRVENKDMRNHVTKQVE